MKLTAERSSNQLIETWRRHPRNLERFSSFAISDSAIGTSKPTANQQGQTAARCDSGAERKQQGRNTEPPGTQHQSISCQPVRGDMDACFRAQPLRLDSIGCFFLSANDGLKTGHYPGILSSSSRQCPMAYALTLCRASCNQNHSTRDLFAPEALSLFNREMALHWFTHRTSSGPIAAHTDETLFSVPDFACRFFRFLRHFG